MPSLRSIELQPIRHPQTPGQRPIWPLGGYETYRQKALKQLAPLKVVQIGLAGKKLQKTTQTQLKPLKVAALDEFSR